MVVCGLIAINKIIDIMSINKVILVGFVAKDPEVREAQGAKVATITLATNERYKTKNGEVKENTEWHTLVCWRQAEFVEKYIAKGAQIYVEGKLRTRSWEDQSGSRRYVTEIVVNDLQSLDRKRDGQTAPQQKFDPHAVQTTPMPTVDDMPDDDLPF